jgi:hypothetical protein
VGCGGDGGVCTGRGAIKGQDAITEVFVQQALDRGGESLATLACRKDGHAVPRSARTPGATRANRRGEVAWRRGIAHDPAKDVASLLQ